MSSVFKIYSPEDCDFYYDGELQGHIDGNSDRAFRFEVERKGAYRLKFVNSEYKSELIVKVSIDADEEREVELDFSEVNEPVIQERERERIIIAIEQGYGSLERLPEEIISVINKNGIVTIPKGVRKIGKGAFARCNSLTSVTIPDSVTEIESRAFSGCHSLTSVMIPDSVTKIGERAFSDCHSLTSVTIPDSVTEMGENTFDGCWSLTSVTIGDSITEIGIGAFDYCSSLREFNGKFASEDNRCLIINSVLNSFATGGLTKYAIPNGITKISPFAFHYCSSLTSVIIPDSVTKIGYCAFEGCKSLTSIIIPDSVTEIGWSAFGGCKSLTSVYCKATTPPKLIKSWFYINKIYVPKSEDSTILEAYKSAEGWKDYPDIIEEYDFDNE